MSGNFLFTCSGMSIKTVNINLILQSVPTLKGSNCIESSVDPDHLASGSK